MAGSRDDGTVAERKENHPNRKVDRANAIVGDLQAMLEGNMAPTKSITDLGKGTNGCSRCSGTGVDPWGDGMFKCKKCVGW